MFLRGDCLSLKMILGGVGPTTFLLIAGEIDQTWECQVFPGFGPMLIWVHAHCCGRAGVMVAGKWVSYHCLNIQMVYILASVNSTCMC